MLKEQAERTKEIVIHPHLFFENKLRTAKRFFKFETLMTLNPENMQIIFNRAWQISVQKQTRKISTN